MKFFLLLLFMSLLPALFGQAGDRQYLDLPLVDSKSDSSRNEIYKLFITGVKEGDTLKIADAYYLQGKFEMVVAADYTAAYKNLVIALNLYRRISFIDGISAAHMQLGVLHFANNNFEDAILEFHDAVRISFKNPKRKGMSFYLMGLCYSELGGSEIAAFNFSQAIKYYEKIDYQQGLAECYVGIGKLFSNEGKYEKAISQFIKGEKYFLNLDAPYALSNIYMYISEAYLLKKDFNNAAKYAELSRTNAIICDSKTRLLNAFNISWKVAEAQHNPDSAFKFLRSYNELKDSIFSENNLKELTALKVKHEQEKRDHEFALVQEKKTAEQKAILDRQKLQNKFLIIVAILFLILALLMFNRYRLKKLAHQLLENKNKIIEAEKRRAEFEKKNAEEAREQALKSEKFKEQFLANMSHEIRTPMNAIMGMTNILLKNQPNEDQLKYLNAISRSSENLLVILNDILDLSKMEAGKLDFEKIPFHLDDVLQNVQDLLRFKAEEKGIKLITRNKLDNDFTLSGDPSRLCQILINLAGNAIKFTDKGMVSVIASTKAYFEKEIKIQFEVEDTGIGIEEDKLLHIFESFTQAYSDTSRKYGGTGLGLTISKELIELQGGQINVQSSKGEGSRFIFDLTYPILQSEIDATLLDIEKVQIQDLKILLVEDNSFNVIVAEDALISEIPGAAIDVAENGLQAVNKVKKHNYDLILMDVQMPEMNGYEACAAIRALTGEKASIPIIAMTANVMKSEVEKCFAAGMDEYVAKPFNVNELMDKIARMTVLKQERH